MSKGKGHTDLNNGKSVVDFAQKRNAHISDAGKFTAIETPRGKMLILANNETFDKHTKSNIKRWLKFLGLMVVVLPFLANYLASQLGFVINWF
jgi:hypothetical protein